MSISHSNTLSKETEKKLQSILKDTPDFQFDLLEHIGTGRYNNNSQHFFNIYGENSYIKKKYIH